MFRLKVQLSRIGKKNMIIVFFSYNHPFSPFWIGLYKETPRPGEKTGWLWLDGQPYDDTMDLWAVEGRQEPTGGADDHCAFLVAKKWRYAPCKAINAIICKRS